MDNYIDELDLISDKDDLNIISKPSELVVGSFSIDFNRVIEVVEFEYRNEKYIKITRKSSKKAKSFSINKKYIPSLLNILKTLQ